METNKELVTFDMYGVFEIRDPALLDSVSAGAVVATADLLEGQTVTDSNTVCVNGACFSLNVWCPTQKICFQVVCV